MFRAELGGTTRNFFYLEPGGSLCCAQAAELAGTTRKKTAIKKVPYPKIPKVPKISKVNNTPRERLTFPGRVIYWEPVATLVARGFFMSGYHFTNMVITLPLF